MDLTQDSPHKTKPYQLGQKAAESIAADLDAFVEQRFDPVFRGYLGVLDQGLRSSLDRIDAPPLEIARIEYEAFVGNVGKLKAKMVPEISLALHGWRDFESIWAKSMNRYLTRSSIPERMLLSQLSCMPGSVR